MQERTRDRRHRRTFWIDDRVIDEFGPVMGRYPFGSSALAVYAVLARRADRDGDSWPRLRAIAEQAGVSPRTVQRAIRLLEMLGLVEVTACYEEGSHRQTSNLYTLLTPPELPPKIDPDPKNWPDPVRRTLLVRGGQRAQSVADARESERAETGVTPRQADTPSPVRLTPSPRQAVAPPHDTLTGQEGNTGEGNPGKDTTHQPVRHGTVFPIAESGLSNRQVWAAALSDLERRGEVGRADLETWLRPAALIGREGETLIVGTPSMVARDRIASRLLPALRDALAGAVGVPLPVVVVVDGEASRPNA